MANVDLERGPLLRVKLLRLGEQEHVLLVNMHHIVSDGWSSVIMVREFSRLYEAYAKGEESPLAEMEIQYGDYAVWQREWLKGEVLEEQMGYWREQLRGLGVLEMPTDYARPAVLSQRGGSVRFEVKEELTRKVKEMSRREGVTVFMSMLAGWSVVLSKYAGQEEVAVGTAVANRRRVETEGLIGFFVNTLVMRVGMGGNPGWEEVLKRVREVTLGGYEHQDVPFEKLVEELQPERDLSRTPLFQVMLVLQNTEQEELRLPGLKLSGYRIASDAAKFELLLTIGEDGGRLRGELNYASDLYEGETAKRILEHWEVALERMVEGGGGGIGEMSLLSGREREQVLEEWNGREARYGEKCVHELFEEQVERSPEAVAVECEGERLSYGELNRRANRLGHYLRKQGVGVEVRVGICVERNVEMVVGLLGILKAGGVYVALDPEYPEERLQYMMKDSGAEVLVTEEQLEGRCGEHGARVVFVGEEGRKGEGGERERRGRRRVGRMLG